MENEDDKSQTGLLTLIQSIGEPDRIATELELIRNETNRAIRRMAELEAQFVDMGRMLHELLGKFRILEKHAVAFAANITKKDG